MYLNKHVCRPCMYVFEIIKTCNHQWSKTSCQTHKFSVSDSSKFSDYWWFHQIISQILWFFHDYSAGGGGGGGGVRIIEFHDFSMHGTFFGDFLGFPELVGPLITLYLIETPFNTFANRADPVQAALVRAAWSGSSLFAYGNMIRYDPTLVDLTSIFFVLCTSMKVY